MVSEVRVNWVVWSGEMGEKIGGKNCTKIFAKNWAGKLDGKGSKKLGELGEFYEFRNFMNTWSQEQEEQQLHESSSNRLRM